MKFNYSATVIISMLTLIQSNGLSEKIITVEVLSFGDL